MIRHVERRRDTQVGDARGCVGPFGSLFVLSGMFATAFAVVGEMPGIGPRLVVLAVGLAHLGGGLLVGWGASRTSVVTRAGIAITHRRLCRATTTEHVTATDVAAVEVHASRGSEGDDVFAPRLRLADGRRVALTVQASPSRDRVVEIASAVARRLALPEGVDW